MQSIPVLVIVGPTASGKTALSIELAKRLDGEIISADSMQIYKGMDIATAKPTKAEMQGIPHHMLGILAPETPYSVAQYCADAGACIRQVASRGKLPILVGGTGLYIDHLLENTQFIETPTDFALREQLNARYETEGGEAMLHALAAFDPETAARLHPNNKKRILRAFEVYALTGQTMSEAVKASKSEPSPYRPLYIGIRFRDRAVLYDRIDRRVDAMLEAGLLTEAKAFFRVYGADAASAAQAIGYKELRPYLQGEMSLSDATEHLKRATRNYAKRQITWFKRNTQIHWLDFDACTQEEFLNSALEIAKTVNEHG